MMRNTDLHKIEKRVHQLTLVCILLCSPWIVDRLVPAYELVGDITIPPVSDSERVAAQDGAFPFHYTIKREKELFQQRLKLEIDFPEGFTGRIAGHVYENDDKHAPKALRVNSTVVSEIAFCHAADAGTYTSIRISFPPGLNQIELSASVIEKYGYTMSWEEKQPVSAAKCLIVWLIAGFAFALKRITSPYTTKKAYLYPILVTSSMVTTIVLALAFNFHSSTRCLIELGQQTPALVPMKEHFDQYLNSSEHSDNQKKAFSVCVLGDSTHKSNLTDRFMPRLMSRLENEPSKAIEIYGIAYFGMGPREYYLIMNRLSREKPDLVVMPVHLRLFTEYLMQQKHNRIENFNHYLNWNEFPRALRIKVADREFEWESMLLKKTDARFFGGAVTPLMNGIKSELRVRAEFSLELFRNLQPGDWHVMPEQTDEVASGEPSGYELIIDKDHMVLPLYDGIMRIANKHDIQILFYPVVLDELRQTELGIQIHVDENYRFLEKYINDNSKAVFYWPKTTVSSHLYVDAWGHMNPEGIQIVADDIFDKVLELSQ